jgi:hypothetical protein
VSSFKIVSAAVFIISLLVIAAAVACEESQAESDMPRPPLITTPCDSAFRAAASVFVYQDTAEDLYPAVVDCETVAEWDAANSVYPDALDGADSHTFLRNLCLYGKLEIEGVLWPLSYAPVCVELRDLDISGQ